MEMITYQTSDLRWLAWPKDRQDILASGETKDEFIENLKAMLIAVTAYEAVNSTTAS
jgi:hypothetical protein